MAWLKRLAAPKWWPIERKTHKFVTVPRGSHPKLQSIPLLIVVRDVLKLADNAREAKRIIKSREVLVDGKPRDVDYGIGFLDSISIPKMKKAWRVIPEKGFKLIEIDDPQLKICKIRDIKILKGGKTQLNLGDGKNIITDKKFSTRDSLLVQLPEQKILKELKLERGALVLVSGGKSAGLISEVKDIDEKNRRAWLSKEEQSIEVPLNYIIVVGKDKPEIKLK